MKQKLTEYKANVLGGDLVDLCVTIASKPIIVVDVDESVLHTPDYFNIIEKNNVDVATSVFMNACGKEQVEAVDATDVCDMSSSYVESMIEEVTDHKM